MQAGPFGDRGHGEVPDAPEFERETLRRRQQILGPTGFVLGRSSPLTHYPSVMHLSMR